MGIGVYGVVAWAELGKRGGVFLTSMGNRNDVGRVRKGKEAVGIASEIIWTFQYYCSAYGVEPFSMMLRNYNNVSADLLTRRNQQEEHEWEARIGMTKIDATHWWGSYATFMPKIGRCQSEPFPPDPKIYRPWNSAEKRPRRIEYRRGPYYWRLQFSEYTPKALRRTRGPPPLHFFNLGGNRRLELRNLPLHYWR